MKKKVGIITFHGAYNYGANLQAFALKTVANEYCDCEIINYACPYFKKRKRTSNKNRIKRFVKILLGYPVSRFSFAVFERFQKEYLTSSKELSHDELMKLNDEYDIFLAGSDQVWNPVHTEYDKTYFLDFVSDNNKKFSYAASFGFTSIPEVYLEEFNRLLSDFKRISVREQTGKCILKNQLGLQGELVLDPTLLIRGKKWKELLFSKRFQETDRGYALIFALNPIGKRATEESKELLKKAKHYASKNKIRIHYINETFLRFAGIKSIRNVTPADFIYLFANAEAVFTDSFHGTAFSVNFNKRFYSQLAPEVEGNRNSRIVDFLNSIGLEKNVENAFDYIESIDYDKVNHKLNQLREHSLNYLKSILE